MNQQVMHDLMIWFDMIPLPSFNGNLPRFVGRKVIPWVWYIGTCHSETSRGWGLVQYQEVLMLAAMVWSLDIHAVTCAVWVPCDVATLMVNANAYLNCWYCWLLCPREDLSLIVFLERVRFLYSIYILIHFASFCLLSYGTSLYLRPC